MCLTVNVLVPVKITIQIVYHHTKVNLRNRNCVLNALYQKETIRPVPRIANFMFVMHF